MAADEGGALPLAACAYEKVLGGVMILAVSPSIVPFVVAIGTRLPDGEGAEGSEEEERWAIPKDALPPKSKDGCDPDLPTLPTTSTLIGTSLVTDRIPFGKLTKDGLSMLNLRQLVVRRI